MHSNYYGQAIEVNNHPYFQLFFIAQISKVMHLEIIKQRAEKARFDKQKVSMREHKSSYYQIMSFEKCKYGFVTLFTTMALWALDSN